MGNAKEKKLMGFGYHKIIMIQSVPNNHDTGT